MALLVLELGALLAQLYVERSNPYIIAFRDGLSLPVSGPPVFTTSNDGYFPIEIGGWDTLENNCPLNFSHTMVQQWFLHPLPIPVQTS